MKASGEIAPRSRGVARAALLCVAVAALSVCAGAGEQPQRYRLDEDNLAWMKVAHPPAAEKLLRGEALLLNAKSAADVEQAAALFKAASSEAPEGWLAPRRYCQALTALGRHVQAVAACAEMLRLTGTSIAFRANVGALMSGPDKPTPEEIGKAMFFARRATELGPSEPWGYAASCDIAAKIGDTEMFDECAERLEAVAPHHYETDRVRSMGQSIRPGIGVLVGWLLIAAAALGTLVHAFRRSARGALGAKRASSIAAVVAVGALAFARDLRADTEDGVEPQDLTHTHTLGKYSIDEKDPSSSVPTPQQRDEDPVNYGYFLMDLGYRAVAASKRGDHAAAARFYEAGVKADPDTAVPYKKACAEYEAMGDVRKAAEYCGAALMKPGGELDDYTHYARILFDKPGGLEPKDITDLDAVAAHLKGGPDVGHATGYDIECQVGARLDDLARLSECAPALAKIAPGDPKATFFQWVLAMKKGDYPAALGLVKQAKERSRDSTHDAQALEMEKATSEALPFWRKGFGFRDWRVGATTAGLLAIGLTLLVLRRNPVSKTRDA